MKKTNRNFNRKISWKKKYLIVCLDWGTSDRGQWCKASFHRWGRRKRGFSDRSRSDASHKLFPLKRTHKQIKKKSFLLHLTLKSFKATLKIFDRMDKDYSIVKFHPLLGKLNYITFILTKWRIKIYHFFSNSPSLEVMMFGPSVPTSSSRSES